MSGTFLFAVKVMSFYVPTKMNINKRNNNEVKKILKRKKKDMPESIRIQCPKCGSIIGIYSYHINSYVFAGNYCENCGAKIDKQRYINLKPPISNYECEAN